MTTTTSQSAQPRFKPGDEVWATKADVHKKIAKNHDPFAKVKTHIICLSDDGKIAVVREPSNAPVGPYRSIIVPASRLHDSESSLDEHISTYELKENDLVYVTGGWYEKYDFVGFVTRTTKTLVFVIDPKDGRKEQHYKHRVVRIGRAGE